MNCLFVYFICIRWLSVCVNTLRTLILCVLRYLFACVIFCVYFLLCFCVSSSTAAHRFRGILWCPKKCLFATQLNTHNKLLNQANCFFFRFLFAYIRLNGCDWVAATPSLSAVVCVCVWNIHVRKESNIIYYFINIYYMNLKSECFCVDCVIPSHSLSLSLGCSRV